MPSAPTDAELLAYLDEMLPVERASVIEQLVRDSTDLQSRLAELISQRDQGGRTVGEIWRRQRLSCPARSQLASHLLGVLPPEQSRYIEFHISMVGCRFCAANLDDLRLAQAAMREPAEQSDRRDRIFESSAGVLRSRRSER